MGHRRPQFTLLGLLTTVAVIACLLAIGRAMSGEAWFVLAIFGLLMSPIIAMAYGLDWLHARRSDQPPINPPRRRWPRFSLRTMCIVVTVFAIPLSWFGQQCQLAHERNAIRKRLAFPAAMVWENSFHDYGEPPPLVCEWLGDPGVIAIMLHPQRFSLKDEAVVARAFPEAVVRIEWKCFRDAARWESEKAARNRNPAFPYAESGRLK